ncbi:MAG: hypothetical protein MUC85_00480 [Anaerolineales bacterium]|jgi:hypothetical protein|nr:hypothetical protein [Anaerolineales bacterium]
MDYKPETQETKAPPSEQKLSPTGIASMQGDGGAVNVLHPPVDSSPAGDSTTNPAKTAELPKSDTPQDTPPQTTPPEAPQDAPQGNPAPPPEDPSDDLLKIRYPREAREGGPGVEGTRKEIGPEIPYRPSGGGERMG